MFEYSALTSSGRLMTGTLEAASLQQAQEILVSMQLTVNEVRVAKGAVQRSAIGRSEFLLFNQQLASITKAGIPLEKGLREIAVDIASPSMRKLTNEIAADLEAGTDIQQAFEKHASRFPPLYGRLLQAGITSGRLSEMLTTLNRHIELSGQTRRIVFEALAYPAVVFALGSAVITLIYLFIVPKFGEILLEMAGSDAQLPMLTRALMAGAKNVGPIWLGVAIVIVAILVLRKALSLTPDGRRFKESILLKLPLLGYLYRCSILSKLAQSMSLTLAAGSDLPASLRLSAGTTGSQSLIVEADILAAELEKGYNLLESSQILRIIPRLFLYSIVLGAQRNELQDNLYALGQMYDQQARSNQARLQAVLLPIMLVCVGGIIGISVLALFLPIIKIVTVLM